MYYPYLAAYAVPLAAGTIGLRKWKKKLTAAGNGLGSAYPMVKFLFILAAVYFGALSFFAAGMTYANYHIFTKNRIAEVTERMGITAGDDVQFKKFFWGFGGPDGSNIRLTLTCEGDVRTMLDTHCLGTLTKFSQDGYIWNAGQDPDDPDETPYFTNSALSAGEITEFYEYQYKGRTFSVSVYDDGSKTRVVIM